MTKRFKFVLASGLMALLLWAMQFVVPEHRLQVIIVAVVLSYLLSVWVLFEDLKGLSGLRLLFCRCFTPLGRVCFLCFCLSRYHGFWVNDLRLM